MQPAAFVHAGGQQQPTGGGGGGKGGGDGGASTSLSPSLTLSAASLSLAGQQQQQQQQHEDHERQDAASQRSSSLASLAQAVGAQQRQLANRCLAQDIKVKNACGEPWANNGAPVLTRRADDNAGALEQQQQRRRRQPLVIDPAGRLFYYWSAVVSLAFLYNFWAISYRFSFQEIDTGTMAVWFALDYSADLVYLLDLLVNFRTCYLEEGVLQRNVNKIRNHYCDCTRFYLDCFCLLPLDVLYLSFGFSSLVRFPRLVKIYKFWYYTDRTERHTNYPNVYRTFTLVHYILVIFHWNACLFHMISKNKIIDIENLYKIDGNQCGDIMCQYLHAFYWSTLALTTVGDLPRPRTKGEYLYVTAELFFGLFLFASVLGHVANIVTNVSAARKEFQAKLDAVKTFMRMRRVSDELQSKVIRWFDYLWCSQRSSDEERSVACLPDRLKAELAIHVHLDTLKRVDIFQNTEAGFLCELVLRLKPVLFSPGDYVCRKNEVGHEMYIVSRGILEVVTNEGKTVVATLKAGSYFGEISVLNVGAAGNKRTASVRSVGYSDLFCLNKQDLWDVLKNYPRAEARIRARAEERLSKLGRSNTAGARQRPPASTGAAPGNEARRARSSYAIGATSAAAQSMHNGHAPSAASNRLGALQPACLHGSFVQHQPALWLDEPAPGRLGRRRVCSSSSSTAGACHWAAARRARERLHLGALVNCAECCAEVRLATPLDPLALRHWDCCGCSTTPPPPPPPPSLAAADTSAAYQHQLHPANGDELGACCQLKPPPPRSSSMRVQRQARADSSIAAAPTSSCSHSLQLPHVGYELRKSTSSRLPGQQAPHRHRPQQQLDERPDEHDDNRLAARATPGHQRSASSQPLDGCQDI